MKHIETDLKKIARLAEQNTDENISFRSFLKSQDAEKIDRIVHKLHGDISSQIDCRECGNCCKVYETSITDADIEKMAGIKAMTKEDFISRYVKKDSFDNTLYLKDTPCIFLDGKVCSIYADRPQECRSYPHTHKKGFISRTLGVIENYETCPIVFNLYESLKAQLGYRL